MTKEKFGTDTAIYNKLFYNSRGQLAEIREGENPNDTGWERGAIINYYSSCWGMCGGHNSTTQMTDNNGNLQKQEVFVPGSNSWLQIYGYDDLNRLQRVEEFTGDSAHDWKQEYVYDRYGNRRIHQTNTSGPSTGPAIPKPNFEVELATNRLFAAGDLAVPEAQRLMQYDAAGNLKKDNFTGAGDRLYDAENRMTKAWANSQWQEYTYNADGQRVRRKVNGVETWAIYGFDGELLAEYAAGSLHTSPQKEYGYRNGQLLITAEPPTGLPPPLNVQNVTWTNVSSTVQVTGNSIQKMSGAYAWDAGAVSTQTIASGNGYVDFVPGETGTFRMCGLGNGDSSTSHSDIEYAFFIYGGGGLSIYESGVDRGSFGSYAASDHLKIAVENGAVKYYRNGTLLYTSTVAPTYPLQVDTSLHTVYAGVYNVVLASNAQNVTWTNVSSTVQATGNSVQKTSGAYAWDAGAVSTQTIASGNGYMDFVPGETGTFRMCGLGNGDSSTSHSDIEYAFFIYGGGGLSIYESGVDRGSFGSYAASDHLKIAVENGVVKYYRNGTLLYTSTVAPTYPLQVDTSLNTVYAGVYNVVITSNTPSSSGNIQWLVTDHLGTPRMVFDQTGALGNVKRHDYLPFGEELVAGQGLRTTAKGFIADGVRQKFTSKERDNETGLDYSINRYYSSTQGRFTSVDPENAGAYAGNPQTWNGYSYGLNNPMLYSDPDGLKVRVCGTDGQCTDSDTDLTDEQWNKWFGGDKSIKAKGGNIYKNGELIGTYQQLSCDSCLYDIHALGRQITASDPGGKALKLWGGSVIAGGTLPSAAAGYIAIGVFTVLVPPGEGGQDAVALGTQADRQAAVREAWRQEAERARTGQPTNTQFTADELRQLRDTGKVSGYEGHHTESVNGNPQSARDASKIKFVKGRAAHLKEHGGNWRNRTPLIRRR